MYLNSGKLSIGSTSFGTTPDATLDVKGDISASGTIENDNFIIDNDFIPHII